MSTLICKYCHKENRSSAKFCYFCGKKTENQPENQIVSVSSSENEKFRAVHNAEVSSSISNTQNTSAVQNIPAKNPDFIGLSEIRARLVMFINTLKIRRRQKSIGMNVSDENSVLVFRGEAGSGKSTVAESFIKMLQSSSVFSSSKNVERTTAHKFQRIYATDVEISKYLSDKKPGIFLVDEIQNEENYLNELLLGLTEKKTDTISILLGLKEPLEKFFKEHSELVDLVSFYDFPDISDENLAQILQRKLDENGFEYDSDVKNLFGMCVSEAKNDSSNIYKNGWIVEKDIFRKILEKQASRLSKMQNISDEDFKKILVQDLPVSKKAESVDDVLSQLDGLIGMEAVKGKVKELCLTVQNNLRRKELGLVSENPKVHIVLTGNPGTGKTTVARLLGKLFFAMRLLPSDKVIETDGLGLTAGYVGQTKDKVNELCDKALGGILFIDEAYYLSGDSNSYGNEAVGTLLKRMEDDRGKFIVIVAGYDKEMQEFLKMNQGLDSRFTHKINIEDYSSDELFEILKLNIKKANFSLDSEAKVLCRSAVDEMCRNKTKNFANAREIRNFFDKIKLNLDSRIGKLAPENLTKEVLSTITKNDIPYSPKKTVSAESVFAELDELIGMENVKASIRELYDTVKINQELEKIGQNPKKPEIHIILTGNPGTGKTTIARLLGKLFFAIGLLASDKVVETDRSKIVAKYVGHTAVNTQKLCDDALGGILFIDEVYTLASDDFGREATDTLMKRMEDDRGKFVVVVAGYENRMQEWLKTNEGLSSRFSHKIHIEDYNSDELFQLFCLYAKKENLLFTDDALLAVRNSINYISENRGADFANGRTIRKFFDSVIRKKNSRIMTLDENQRTKEVLMTIEKEDIEV